MPSNGATLRAAVHGADALIIASREYARGVSGVMKNAQLSRAPVLLRY
ncbi:MAG: NAD(P)H-dependent oxidoreductase [Burkholderiales bacterium]|nr:NAD(P)H-dependent oxidoreductase [Burkholderiales bacterium]